MLKKINIEKIVSTVEQTAKDALGSAVHAADQNDDGKFNMEDVAVIADNVGDALKKSAQSLKETADERARTREENALRPIFSSTLVSPDFVMPKFIQLTDRDKKHAESAVCKGSIGYNSSSKNISMITVFCDSVDAFGLTFYPDENREFYYVDPIDRNHYIAMNEYFEYIQVCCVKELEGIAQSLGAKHFRITYKEERASFADKKVTVKGRTDKSPAANATIHAERSLDFKSEIKAEDHFPGRDPIQPTLKYMQRYPSIQSLVSSRMDASNPLKSQKFSLKMSTSCGITANVGAQIDARLKEMKYSLNMSAELEAKQEFNRYLEYEIDF